MTIITQKYTIRCFSYAEAKDFTKTFTIKFDRASYPKDIWDHNDAVEDYLIDTNQNPFVWRSSFAILETHIHEVTE